MRSLFEHLLNKKSVTMLMGTCFSISHSEEKAALKLEHYKIKVKIISMPNLLAFKNPVSSLFKKKSFLVANHKLMSIEFCFERWILNRGCGNVNMPHPPCHGDGDGGICPEIYCRVALEVSVYSSASPGARAWREMGRSRVQLVIIGSLTWDLSAQRAFWLWQVRTL